VVYCNFTNLCRTCKGPREIFGPMAPQSYTPFRLRELIKMLYPIHTVVVSRHCRSAWRRVRWHYNRLNWPAYYRSRLQHSTSPAKRRATLQSRALRQHRSSALRCCHSSQNNNNSFSNSCTTVSVVFKSLTPSPQQQLPPSQHRNRPRRQMVRC